MANTITININGKPTELTEISKNDKVSSYGLTPDRFPNLSKIEDMYNQINGISGESTTKKQMENLANEIVDFQGTSYVDKKTGKKYMLSKNYSPVLSPDNKYDPILIEISNPKKPTLIEQFQNIGQKEKLPEEFRDTALIKNNETINNTVTKTGTNKQNKEFKPLDLTRTETASLPKEYIDLYAKMANGQMGNNQYRRPIIAGGNDTGGGQATNFLGSILQGASESIGNNLEKWSSGEQGKADFWNRIVPALEKASGRKITGLTDRQFNELNQKYKDAQVARDKLGEKIKDEDLKNIADSVIQNKQNLEQAQQMTPAPYFTMENPVDYAKARLDQSQIEQQQAIEKNKKYDDLSNYLNQIQSQASSNEGGTQVGTGPDINTLQTVQNAEAMLPVNLERAKQKALADLALYAQKMNIQLDKDMRLLQARKDILGENSINGVNNILGQIMNLQTPQPTK